MSAITYALLGLVTLGVLNFSLKWRSVKKVAVKSFHHLSRKSSVIVTIHVKGPFCLEMEFERKDLALPD